MLSHPEEVTVMSDENNQLPGIHLKPGVEF